MKSKVFSLVFVMSVFFIFSTSIHNLTATSSIVVTPVEGPSTLTRLGLSIEQTSMGWTGQWRALPNIIIPTRQSKHSENISDSLMLSGDDLYRISCRACHMPDGSGAPPETNSIIGPVQSASIQWMTQRMLEKGRKVDPVFLRQLTSSTEADLQNRLKIGGHNMPSFAHLSSREIKILRPHLDALADLPKTNKNNQEILEPATRVGELIVKGTCHICHDAIGPDNNQATALNRFIPSLLVISHQKTLVQFVQKVREGTQIPMGIAGMTSRGRMPVFNYLSDSEVAAAYLYLINYPPKEVKASYSFKP